ncbi:MULTISPECIES: hypothetical protein [Burkholderia]|uniref:hypothetical protein n=1 Tax=Burkholderia TaxID=32008 RepID=UPI000DC4C369|nr:MULTISPECIES: hypothetical protein [Burkholderia]MDP9549689.1 hypothetical protein [Burkholderia cepacia]MBR8393362.1 hypothetical protein [Burkholderia cenocepacia]MBR8473281.1 hypothetical protein [Burkholderia cenocepacia]MBR8491762.1 hypothetical protein [Burkholderia cenocepacia]MDO5919700.1 hypothetical protein [Burkholderia cenocepacia]
MSDINVAPSSTEAAEIAADSTGNSAGGNSAENAAISSAATEAGAAAVGESLPSTSADSQSSSGDDPNVAASPAAGQSASDIASSAQDASQGGDTAAAALRAELDAANSRIAALQQQVMDEQERVIKWQGLYNSATEAKPHAESILQKLEAGEAIVLGDLQSRLRAFVDAL